MNRKWNLAPRVALIVGCGGILYSIAQAVPFIRDESDPFNWVFFLLMFSVFASIACGGIWLGLFGRRKMRDEIAEDVRTGLPQPTEISPDASKYYFSTGLRSLSVMIDQSSGTIHFGSCYTPRRFLAMTLGMYSCPLRDLRGVYFHRHRRHESLTIVTTDGKAVIPNSGPDFGQLRHALGELHPKNYAGYARFNPRLGKIGLVLMMVGATGGVALSPSVGSVGAAGLLVFAGGLSGLALGNAILWCIDRRPITNLSRPLRIGAGGIAVGAGAAGALVPYLGWNWLIAIAFAAVGGAFGTILGRRVRESEQQELQELEDRHTV